MFSGRISRFWQRLSVRVLLVSSLIWLGALLVTYLYLANHLRSQALARLDEELKTAVFLATHLIDSIEGEVDTETLREEVEHVSLIYGGSHCFVVVFDAQGNEVVATDRSSWPVFEPPRPAQTGFLTAFVLQTHVLQGHPGYRSIFYAHPNGLIFEVGFSLAEMQRELTTNLRALGYGVGLAFLLSLVLGTIVLKRTLRGIRTISLESRKIRTLNDLSHRIALPTGSYETDELALTLNQMVANVDHLVSTQRQVVNHIAHDVRSPVTRLRALGESASRDPNFDREDWAGQVVEDCDRLLHLVNQLLEIAQAESGLLRLEIETIDLNELLEDAIDLFHILAEEKNLELVKQDASDSVCVQTDRRLLQRLCSNLLDNALKYTQAGQIRLGTLVEPGKVGFFIEDTGMGMDPEQVSQVFERFYRGDPARTQPGFGLGLAFCHAAAKAMNAELVCHSELGVGTRFELRFSVSLDDEDV